MFKHRMLVAMEDEGHMDTSDGLKNRVAKYLTSCPNDTINTAELRSACIVCNVDHDSFMQSNLDKSQKKLSKLTQTPKENLT